MLNRPISPFAFKWESHAAGTGGSLYTGIWHKQVLSQSSGKPAPSHRKGRAEASRCQKLLVLSLENVTGATPDYIISHELIIWVASNCSLRSRRFLSMIIFCVGFTLFCLRQTSEPWTSNTVLPECQPGNILKDNRKGQLPHGNMVKNIYIFPLTLPTKRSTLRDLVLAVTLQCCLVGFSFSMSLPKEKNICSQNTYSFDYKRSTEEMEMLPSWASCQARKISNTVLNKKNIMYAWQKNDKLIQFPERFLLQIQLLKIKREFEWIY